MENATTLYEKKHQSLINRAYASPSLRQNILNAGMICLYCDFSGHDEHNFCGLACCFVHNKTIKVYAKKVPFEYIGNSVYGELLAILYSLEILGEELRDVLSDHRPKIALLYTDYSRIAQLLSSIHHSKPIYEEIGNRIAITHNDLEIRYPGVEVRVKYISKHKKNNALHKMAHIAARKTIGK
ncbi:hypothetical protein [Cohnella yongneupensis]|uniref:RNase H type-1 domain-containing protein n=1 Tax=Cohnella yongneupensis TaxID=425006 RepID=A0ABW0QTS8_9BACL